MWLQGPFFFVGRDLADVVQWPWKLIRYGRKPGELFNLDEDREETMDKSRDAPEKLRELQPLLSTWKDTSPRFQSQEGSMKKPVVEPSGEDLKTAICSAQYFFNGLLNEGPFAHPTEHSSSAPYAVCISGVIAAGGPRCGEAGLASPLK